MIVSRTIGALPVLVECDASLEPAADDVLRTLAELARDGTPPGDGFRMRFGWSLLTLRAESGGLRVCEPLFTGDPETELNPTLDTTLGVIAAQLGWLRLLHEQGSDIAFDQQIVFAAEAAAAADVFALHGDATGPADSGWSVAPVPEAGGRIDMAALQAMPIYRLVALRPGLLPILTLPVGYLVQLKGDDVTEVDAPDGRVAWRSSGPRDQR